MATTPTINGSEPPKFKVVPEPPKETKSEPPAESAPKRRGRPPGSKNRSSARTPSLENQIGALLVSMNFVVMIIPPLSRDALDDAEITALARAIDQQCKTSPRFRKYVETALAAGSGGQLMTVALMIVARRASRHGILPENLDPAIGTMLASQTGPAPRSPFNAEYVPPEPAIEPVPEMLNEA